MKEQIMKISGGLAIACICLLSVGCFEGSGNDIHPEDTHRIIKIDGCEYIFVSRRPFSGDMAITHKGDCCNPIHR